MVVDLHSRRIPNQLVLVGLWGGILYLVMEGGLSGLVLGGIRIGVTVLGVFLIYQWSAFGAGDLKLISIISLFFNWEEFATWLLISLLCGGVLAVPYYIRGERKIPFAVALFAGMLVTLLTF